MLPFRFTSQNGTLLILLISQHLAGAGTCKVLVSVIISTKGSSLDPSILSSGGYGLQTVRETEVLSKVPPGGSGSLGEPHWEQGWWRRRPG